MKSVQITLLLALLLSFASLADAQTDKSRSFKSGFSSQKSSSTRSSSSFGAFGGRSTAPPRAPAPAQAGRNSGFGSFGGATAPAPRQSDSALSERLSKKAAQDNAVRTLEARRRAEQDAMNAAARPVPSGPLPGANPYAGRHESHRGADNAPAMPPVIVQQGSSGISNVITGFLLGRAMAPSHAATHGYPGAARNSTAPAAASGPGFLMTMLRTFAWLVIAAVLGWTAWFAWKFLSRGKAASQANYSFER